MEHSKTTTRCSRAKKPQRVVVLRWGHRPQRDARLTTHVALAARALGASGFVLSDAADEKIKETIAKVSEAWGGDFSFEMATPWKKTVRDWRNRGGVTVHLTAYGENVETSDALKRIKDSGKDVLVLVGSQKVPREFYSGEVSDFNVAVGNQPHSECAALAVFLDRFFEGKTVGKVFDNAKMRIIPQKRGKKLA
ncbi:MAG: tRNA (cytidine(56)-2'-O)-methyltransferase [Candidatus Bathyarchaeia archaeon]